MEMPDLRFAIGPGGARIAYQQWGEGIDVVAVPPLVQNIEAAWGWPDVAHMLERFGRIGRFTHYDKRGTGASDRILHPPTRDQLVDDMRGVMDEAEVERAWLMGFSDGGPTALLFAAAFPERVHGLLLFGSGANTERDVPPEQLDAHLERQRRAARLWGTEESPWVDHFAPSLAGHQSFREWHRRYERACCDSATLYDLLVMSIGTDVTEVLPDVRCPVVAVHRTDDRIVPVARSREVVDELSDARLVELPGEDHFGYAGDADAWLDVFEEVVTGTVAVATPRLGTRPRVALRTLGRFAVEVDGDDVPSSAWGSRHARTIVKRLAVARGWPVRRDELFELLWPDERDRGKVGARLSVQLSTVRRVLRGGVIADRDSVRLDLGEVDLDLAVFDDTTEDAAIVAGYTGTFLPEDLDAPWTAATRAEVATRFAAAAAREGWRRLADDRPGRAAEIACRMIATNPLDVTGHELLVASLLATNHLDEAARAHAAWVAAGEELGVRVPPLEPG